METVANLGDQAVEAVGNGCMPCHVDGSGSAGNTDGSELLRGSKLGQTSIPKSSSGASKKAALIPNTGKIDATVKKDELEVGSNEKDNLDMVDADEETSKGDAKARVIAAKAMNLKKTGRKRKATVSVEKDRFTRDISTRSDSKAALPSAKTHDKEGEEKSVVVELSNVSTADAVVGKRGGQKKAISTGKTKTGLIPDKVRIEDVKDPEIGDFSNLGDPESECNVTSDSRGLRGVVDVVATKPAGGKKGSSAEEHKQAKNASSNRTKRARTKDAEGVGLGQEVTRRSTRVRDSKR
jgi:hypothetical protein